MTDKNMTDAFARQWAMEKDKDFDDYWNALSKEDQIKAFYSVCKRIHKGDIQDRGSYRYVLYDVFGFDGGSYVLGMNCGYFSIHNLLFEALEAENKTHE